jgi:hypothetical protein
MSGGTLHNFIPATGSSVAASLTCRSAWNGGRRLCKHERKRLFKLLPRQPITCVGATRRENKSKEAVIDNQHDDDHSRHVDVSLYRVLGVNPSASQTEIKFAFRRLARSLHPDVNPSPSSHRRFKVRRCLLVFKPLMHNINTGYSFPAQNIAGSLVKHCATESTESWISIP